MITVYRAADITEAHLIAGMLQAEGIEARVQGHYLQGGVGELGTMDFARIDIPEQDLERARPLLQQYEQAHKKQLGLSPETRHDQGVRFDATIWLAIPIAIFFALLLILI